MIRNSVKVCIPFSLRNNKNNSVCQVADGHLKKASPIVIYQNLSSINFFCSAKDSHSQSETASNRQQKTKQSKKAEGASQGQEFTDESDAFTVLGVEVNASEQQIKAAYLQRVKKYHPDLSKLPNAAAKFQQIQSAYQTLTDAGKRADQKEKIRKTKSSSQPKFDQKIYQEAESLKEQFKSFSRKKNVPDEWQFSYKLYKDHYEKMEEPKKQYTKYEGQGDHYWVHESEKQTKTRVKVQQVAMILGSFTIVGAAMLYVWRD